MDGAALEELDTRSWQRRLAVICQDYVRYELDAAANIGLGAPGHLGDARALERAIAWAGAAEVTAALPDGLATILSSRYSRGVDLSGAQWQRIALARALFAVQTGACVLILDEPTAQLDARAEVAFVDRFLELTHRLISGAEEEILRRQRDAWDEVTTAMRPNCTARCTGTPPPVTWYS